MNSPVEIPFTAFIQIDRQKKETLYLQIVYQFINAVRTNLLENNDQLPGSRKIAGELKVHRKTVIAALNELEEQGWVKIVPNIGVFVGNPEQNSIQAEEKVTFRQPLEKAQFDFRKEVILNNPIENLTEKLYFTEGTPDYRIIKSNELLRFYTSVLRRKKNVELFSSSWTESVFFRDQLSYYLNLTRGFHLSRDFLLPIAGQEQVHSILSRLLIKTGDVVLVEELSYFLPNMIYNQAGAKMKTVPVDGEGMDIDYIENNFKPGAIRFVYINTKCQYPTTVNLSNARQKKLLRLAEAYDFLIIEDDSDFEFSSMRSKKESLFREDGGKRVIYLGAFGRFLNPGFQMNFIIAPKDFLTEAAKYLNIFGKPNPMMEKALGELIHQGDIHRYQRKSKKIIGERKVLLAELLREKFKDEISFTVPPSGLAFWIQFHNPVSLVQLQQKAKEKGLFISNLCLYQNRKITALRLGFAHLDAQEMEEAVEVLRACL